MDLLTENHSLYPRVGQSDEELRLRRAYHRHDRGEIDTSELHAIEDDYAEDVIGEQVEAGLDVVTDGMIRWYDHVSHMARGLTDVEVAGLVRFFDTNYLVRELEVTGPVEWSRPIVTGEYELARSVSDRPVKMVLPGPATLAQHSILENAKYRDPSAVASDYARALKQEIQELREHDLQYLQIDEPWLTWEPEDAGWALPLVDEVLEAAGEVETRLATYFGDAVDLYDELQVSAADVLTLDFTYSDDLVETIRSRGTEKRLGLGLLNGRNTKLEDTSAVCRRLEELSSALPDGSNILTFSCSIDYLPRDRARRKLRRLVEIRDTFLGGDPQ